jgi:hypothetical protein
LRTLCGSHRCIAFRAEKRAMNLARFTKNAEDRKERWVRDLSCLKLAKKTGNL